MNEPKGSKLPERVDEEKINALMRSVVRKYYDGFSNP